MSATVEPAVTTSTLRRRALGVAAAVLACVVLWTVGRAAGVDYTVESPGQPAMVIGLGPVITISLASTLVGWAALAVLERVTRRGTLIWTVLAALVALLSLLPLAGVEASTGAKLALGAMHAAVAVVLIALLPNRTR
ncbi:DUF6069 family protein [Micromonospora sp. GCM10011542]|uniref:DUF6069 family protein n=1 Tax=Micromonospora sp. GCM10011542 TaxID=3317337 RepID=UPI0036167DCC